MGEGGRGTRFRGCRRCLPTDRERVASHWPTPVYIYIYIYTFHRFDLRPAINSWLISLAWGGEEGCKVGKLVRVPRYRKQMLSVHVLLDTSADPLLGLL